MGIRESLERCFSLISLSVIFFLCTCTRQSPRVSDANEAHREIEWVEPTITEPLEDIVVGSENAPKLLRLAVISDMNGSYGSTEYSWKVTRAIDMILDDSPDLVINAGDMVAGQRAKLPYRAMWSAFHAVVTDRLVSAKIPMAQVVGNHDGSGYPSYVEEREIYIDEWQSRKPDLDYVDDENYPLFYSFMSGGLFFLGLDASTLEKFDSLQYSWLETQLSKNPTNCGAIVVMHVPLFAISTRKPTERVRDDRLHALFVKHGVSLVISGHQHAYFPAKLDGVTYFLSGAQGDGPRHVRQNGGIEPSTLSFLDIFEDGSLHIDTFVLSDMFEQKFNHNLLPTYMVLNTGILPRIDVSY